MDALAEFKRRSTEIIDLRSMIALASWDQLTMMPPRGSAPRARQYATLCGVYHSKLTDPRIGKLIEQLKDAQADPWIACGLRELEREHLRAVRVPESLARELGETTSLAYEQWVMARERSDFGAFAPWLAKVIRLKREQARCLAPSGTPLYDALLEEYEPGMNSSTLAPLFSSVRGRLQDLLRRIQASPLSRKAVRLADHYPRDLQEEFGRRILTAMGFEWEAGRLDQSPHPFCSGFNPLDVRITTRYSESDFTRALFGVIHEGGHALYEQGLGITNHGLLSCDALSLGIHESQARLWENQIGRSQSFWLYWYPRLKESFPGQFDHLDLGDFLLAINRVVPSPIRVEADEVTYGLHVILRFELERELIETELDVAGLPELWQQKMEDLLGISPESDREGILQDTHWSQGLIGYFPTYLLGNLYAGQFYEEARKSLPRLEEQLESGEAVALREWLRENIHRWGRTLSAAELIQRVSGEPLDSKYFLDYLEGKYGHLYEL